MTKCTQRRYTEDATPERTPAASKICAAQHCARVLGLPPRVFGVSTSGRIIKRLFIGRAMRSDRLGETLLPKRIASSQGAEERIEGPIVGSVRRGE